MLNDLSFLIILSLISVPVPGIIVPIQEAILSFIYIDIFQTDGWLPPIFFTDNDDDSGLNNIFDINSFRSTRAIKNLGSTTLFIALYSSLFFTLILAKILKCLIPW